MSNKQYILRKPVTKKDFVYDGYKLPYYTIEALKSIDFSTIHPEQFQELFVEFDEDLLRQQIRSEIDKAILRALTEFAEHVGYEETIQYESIYEADCADAVLALIVGEKS